MGGSICSVKFRIARVASDLINLWPRVSDVNQVEQSSAPPTLAVASETASPFDARMTEENTVIQQAGIIMDPLITKRINFS